MAWLKNVGRRRRDAPRTMLCNPDAFRVLCGSGYTRLADCPEVQMCVHVYADLISSMTIYLMQNTDLGDVRIKNGLSRRLDIAPNPFMTRKTFIYNLVRTLLLDGDGNQITLPRYDADGLLTELRPVSPSHVTLMQAGDGYTVSIDGKAFDPSELLHFAINPDPEFPWRGTGYKAVLRDVIAGLQQANATKKALLESPTPSLIVKVDGLSEEFSSPEGRKKLGSQYLDASENGKPWFIPAEAFSVDQVRPLTLNDLAIAQNMEIDKRTVASIFGVPPYMVGVGDYSKEAHNAFITTRVMPLAKSIEQELTRKLLYSEELYWRFSPSSLYAYDIGERITAGSAMVDRMAMRRNEWRDWIGLSPDADMVDLLALENYIPADRLGDQKKLAEGGDNNDE